MIIRHFKIDKKSTLVLFLFLSTIPSFSQTSKGNKLIGVNTNLSYKTAELDASIKLSTFNLFLKGGYFINDDDVVGLNFGYQTSKQTGIDEQSVISYGIFGRHYFFGVIFTGIGFNSVKYDEFDAFNTLPIEVGYATFIREIVSIEPSITYEVGLSRNSSNAFAFLIGFGLYLD